MESRQYHREFSAPTERLAEQALSTLYNNKAVQPLERNTYGEQPCPTVCGTQANQFVVLSDRAYRDKRGAFGHEGEITEQLEKRKFTIAEVKRICAFPDDFQLVGSYAQQWACLGNSVPPVMMYHIARTIDQQIFQQLS